VIAEYPTSNWVQNLQSKPVVQVRVSGQTFSASARVLQAKTDDALRMIIQDLSRKKYGWGDGAVVELKPNREQELKIKKG